MRVPTAWVSASILAAYMAGAVPASAQTGFRPYVGGSLGSFSVGADEVEGGSVAGGLFGGIALSRYVDVEFEVVLPVDTFTRSYTGLSVSFAPPGAPRAEIERLGVITRFDKARDVTASVSGVVIIHPPLGKRLTPGFIVGVSNQRVRDQTVYTPVSIPDGVDPRHPAVVGHTESSTRNIGGPTIGANLAIAITPHVSIVPDVRYDYGSIGDEINNVLRASVRVQWRF
jgi:Outer membrane protein beta-barrel domain